MSVIKNYEDHLENQGLSQGYRTSLLLQKDLFLRWQNQTQKQLINYSNLMEYVGYCRNRNLKKSSLEKVVLSLRYYLGWLEKTDKIKTNPALELDLKGNNPRPFYDLLSREELDNLYKNYPLHKDKELHKSYINIYEKMYLSSHRDQVITGLLVYQGLETGDIKRLKTEDLDLKSGELNVRRGIRINARTLKLESSQMYDLLVYEREIRPEIMEKKGLETDYLFTSTGKSLQLGQDMARIYKNLKKINEKLVSLHHIRSSVIRHWLKSFSLRVVQEKAGHRYVSSTEKYLENDVEDLTRNLEKYHPY